MDAIKPMEMETQEQILSRLTEEMRGELATVVQEKLAIINVSLRPMYFKDGQIEYGSYPPEVEAILKGLDERAEKVIHRYEKMASAQCNSLVAFSRNAQRNQTLKAESRGEKEQESTK